MQNNLPSNVDNANIAGKPCTVVHTTSPELLALIGTRSANAAIIQQPTHGVVTATEIGSHGSDTLQNDSNYSPIASIFAAAAVANHAGMNVQRAILASARNTRKLSPTEQKVLDAFLIQTLRRRMRAPISSTTATAGSANVDLLADPLSVIKNYLISVPRRNSNSHYRNASALRQPLRCADLFTQQQFLCRIVNEPLDKVQQAYLKLQHEEDRLRRSHLYGHLLVRDAFDMVAMNSRRTFVVLTKPVEKGMEPFEEGTPALPVDFGSNVGEWTFAKPFNASLAPGSNRSSTIYEDLHTYIRNKRRLDECEARNLFHQVAQTVQLCHNNGIILRDLKLKRFFFIDEARTKLQYESLEGSMILRNPDDDMLSDKIGCPLYTAPELLCPTPTYRGKPADMWALGIILYTMLVGQYPFYERLNCNLITLIRHGNVQFPSSISRPARSLIMQLLHKNYEDRCTANYIFGSYWLRTCRPCYTMSVNICFEDDDVDQMAAFGDTVKAGEAQSFVSSNAIAQIPKTTFELKKEDCMLKENKKTNATVNIVQQAKAELQLLRAETEGFATDLAQ